MKTGRVVDTTDVLKRFAWVTQHWCHYEGLTESERLAGIRKELEAVGLGAEEYRRFREDIEISIQRGEGAA